MKLTHETALLATEEDIAVLPGDKPGTALRVRLDTGREGHVRLEQMAYSPSIGWYVRKSFPIACEMLQALIPQLRKCACLLPPPAASEAPALRIGPALPGALCHVQQRKA